MESAELLKSILTAVGAVSAALVAIFLGVRTRKKGMRDNVRNRLNELEAEADRINLWKTLIIDRKVEYSDQYLKKITTKRKANEIYLNNLSNKELIRARVPLTQKKISVKKIIYYLFGFNILLMPISLAVVQLYPFVLYVLICIVSLEIVILLYVSYFALFKEYTFEDF